MRTVIQRVEQAKVNIYQTTVGKIDRGLLIFLGITHNDTEKELKWLANKIKDLRIFEDENGKMNLSLEDVRGEILIVSQFTLYGNCIKGRRPAFIEAARPELAEGLYLKFIEEFKNFGIKTESGEFGADMKVELINDGPVTLIIDTDNANIK
ncbi:MAG: D-aminoacyl-tRNA deacylase [Fusobacterium sp.]|uniref:D-aminoacyl-tRNA deacylase n=1 Tax=Fusobacterium sp. TaxID=68766 RepID=UPI0026DC8247|nr:D-aminoacyl-tRNA deacylase [Fusobacterium sp.]MDO4690558.1 D-aminoacyl-tRNA deacylase [Fusobacterium sp.]